MVFIFDFKHATVTTGAWKSMHNWIQRESVGGNPNHGHYITTDWVILQILCMLSYSEPYEIFRGPKHMSFSASFYHSHVCSTPPLQTHDVPWEIWITSEYYMMLVKLQIFFHCLHLILQHKRTECKNIPLVPNIKQFKSFESLKWQYAVKRDSD